MTLLALLPVFAVLAVLVKVETGGVLVGEPRIDERRPGVIGAEVPIRRARSVARPGTTFSVAISGRIGPVGQLLRHTRLAALPDWCGHCCAGSGTPAASPAAPSRLSAPAGSDEPEVHARELAR